MAAFLGQSGGNGNAREDNCPPHHWTIVTSQEDGIREDRLECQLCGDVRLVRSPVWETTGRRMANTSTWTPEDRILDGEEEGDELEATG